MRNGFAAIAAILLIAAFGQAHAQTTTEMLEHLDDLGKSNEKLQERVRILENENKALRERLRQLGIAEPSPAPAASQPPPIAGRPNMGEAAPPPRMVPAPAPAPDRGAAPAAANGTIDLDSSPQGAQVTTSLGAECETPCSMEISAAGAFTVTFTHPGYEQTTVNVGVQAAQPGISNPKFSPNPVFVELTRQAKKKPAVSAPQKLGPAH